MICIGHVIGEEKYDWEMLNADVRVFKILVGMV